MGVACKEVKFGSETAFSTPFNYCIVTSERFGVPFQNASTGWYDLTNRCLLQFIPISQNFVCHDVFYWDCGSSQNPKSI